MKVNEYNELHDLLAYEEDEARKNYKENKMGFYLGVQTGLWVARQILTRFMMESNKPKGEKQ